MAITYKPLTIMGERPSYKRSNLIKSLIEKISNETELMNLMQAKKVAKYNQLTEDILIETNKSEYSELSDDELKEVSKKFIRECQTQCQDLSKSGKRKFLYANVAKMCALFNEVIIRAKMPSNREGEQYISGLTPQQFKGGLALYDNFLQMYTGEGKTLTSMLNTYMRVCLGERVQIHTVNEYLAFRDHQTAAHLFSKLGITVGLNLSFQGFQEYILSTPSNKKMITGFIGLLKNKLELERMLTAEQIEQQLKYQEEQMKLDLYMKFKHNNLGCDVVYGESNEFRFDYLRHYTSNSRHPNPNIENTSVIIDEADKTILEHSNNALSMPIKDLYGPEFYENLKIMGEGVIKRQKSNVDSILTMVQNLINERDTEGSNYLIKFFDEAEEMGFNIDISKFNLYFKSEKIKIVIDKYDPSNDIKEKQYCYDYLSEVLKDKKLRGQVYHAIIAEKITELLFAIPSNKLISAYPEFEGMIRQYYEENNNTLFAIRMNGFSRLMSIFNDSKWVENYDETANIFKGNLYYSIEPHTNSINLTPNAIDLLESFGLSKDDPLFSDYLYYLRNYIYAVEILQESKNFMIKDGKLILLNTMTGRTEESTKYSGGLNEVVEIMHGIKVSSLNFNWSNITSREFYQRYADVVGLSGTAKYSEEDFSHLFDKDVIAIEHNKGNNRRDYPLKFYHNYQYKFDAIIKETDMIAKTGRPVLLGVETGIEAENYKQKLIELGYVEGKNLFVLSAETSAQDGFNEAELIKNAGKTGVITIATNMAGRGTDIKLDQGVNEKGGLHVILSYFVQDDTIEQQFIGRAGRLGDYGSSSIFGCYDDLFFRKLMTSINYKTSAYELFSKMDKLDDLKYDLLVDSYLLHECKTRVKSILESAFKNNSQYPDSLKDLSSQQISDVIDNIYSDTLDLALIIKPNTKKQLEKMFDLQFTDAEASELIKLFNQPLVDGETIEAIAYPLYLMRSALKVEMDSQRKRMDSFEKSKSTLRDFYALFKTEFEDVANPTFVDMYSLLSKLEGMLNGTTLRSIDMSSIIKSMNLESIEPNIFDDNYNLKAKLENLDKTRTGTYQVELMHLKYAIRSKFNSNWLNVNSRLGLLDYSFSLKPSISFVSSPENEYAARLFDLYNEFIIDTYTLILMELIKSVKKAE